MQHKESQPYRLPARSLTRVLVVDDDRIMVDVMIEMLRGLGFRDIASASSGAQGLQKIAGDPKRFDLILLDLHMPGMDGFEFMDGLAKTGYGGALLIVSGQDEDVMKGASIVARLRRFTLLGSVNKPVTPAGLSALLPH